MSRRNNAHLRCALCRMHGSLCICALIPKIATQTKLVLMIHRIEARKPTNTGQLGAACLSNSEVLVRGHAGEPTPRFDAPEGTDALLLFPHEEAISLDLWPKTRPVTLVVPDGTWRQASKVRQRVPGLSELPCVTLPPDEPSRYRLRSEAHGHGLATIEAIARAMGILEGLEVRRAIEQVFHAMVERTLWSRGELDDHEVTLGVPEGALRHDPTSGLARESS